MALGDKVSLDMNEGGLIKDLEGYCDLALDSGASKAKAINTSTIPVDERVTAKCRLPRCFGYGTSANCPPHSHKPDEMRRLIDRYKWAVLFTKEHPVELMMRERTDPERTAAFQAVSNIACKLESAAFYDGRYFAFGLGAGSCKSAFCGVHKTCQALEGGACRHPGKARPSMEAVGIDVYQLVCLVGWDIYMIGGGADPGAVPKASLTGVVMVQ